MATQPDDDDPMGDVFSNSTRHTRQFEPTARSRRGGEKGKKPEPPSSGEEKDRKCSPSPGELEEPRRPRRDGVDTAESWGSDGQGNLVHRNPCKVCKTYALHVYNHAFDRDSEYLDAKERRDMDIAAGEISRANRRYDDYEDEIDKLRGQLRRLQDQLDDRYEGRPTKKAKTRESSPSPERSRGKDYASVATRPAPLKATSAVVRPSLPPASSCPIAHGGDVVMKEAYPPLPRVFPPKVQPSVPGPPKTANWNPAPLPAGTIPSALPQNIEEFDTWAQSAHITGNYQMLQRVREYVRYVNETAPGARSPLMNHVLASWLPEDQQSARGIRRLRDPNRLEQPGVFDSPERWAQFMHRHLYQWQSSPGVLLDHRRVSLPHVRGQLLIRQQLFPGLTQRQKFGLYIRLMEVFVLPGLYRQTRERLGLLVAEDRRRLTMSNITDNTTLEEVVRHLAAIGVTDTEVREAHHYAVAWLTATANSSSPRPEESSAASEILNRLKNSPNSSSGDAPLMTEPRWWIPSSSDVSLTAPRGKRNRDAAAPRRGGAHAFSARPIAETTLSYQDPPDYVGGSSQNAYAGPSRVDNQPLATIDTSSAEPEFLPPAGRTFVESDPSGGWRDFPFPIKPSRAQKRQNKIERRVASGIPPRGFGGAASDNRFRTFARTMRRKRGDEESEYTDSVSDSGDEPVDEVNQRETGSLGGNQSIDNSLLDKPSETPVSQVPSLPSDNDTILMSTERVVPEHERPISLSPTLEPMLLDSDMGPSTL